MGFRRLANGSSALMDRVGDNESGDGEDVIGRVSERNRSSDDDC